MIDPHKIPRLPLEGSIDLTYRCNNRCLHCWLWTADREEIRQKEMTLDEIRDIALRPGPWAAATGTSPAANRC